MSDSSESEDNIQDQINNLPIQKRDTIQQIEGDNPQEIPELNENILDDSLLI